MTILIRHLALSNSDSCGDVVRDGCGYTFSFYRDDQGLRVWRCTFRGFVKFPRCYSILKQVKRTEIDFYALILKKISLKKKRIATLLITKKEKRQLTFILGNISTHHLYFIQKIAIARGSDELVNGKQISNSA